jgi:hypothetical protein
MLRLRGTAHHFDKPLVGTVTRQPGGEGDHQFLVVDAGDPYPTSYAYGAVLTAILKASLSAVTRDTWQ